MVRQIENPVAGKGPYSYLWPVTTIIMAAGVIIIAVLWLRPVTDPVMLIGAVLFALAPTITSVINGKKQDATHDMINSRYTKMLEVETRLAGLDGEARGAQDERVRMIAELAVKDALLRSIADRHDLESRTSEILQKTHEREVAAALATPTRPGEATPVVVVNTKDAPAIVDMIQDHRG